MGGDLNPRPSRLRLRLRTLMALVAVAAVVAAAAAVAHKSRAVKGPTPYQVPVDDDESIYDTPERDMGPQYPHKQLR